MPEIDLSPVVPPDATWAKIRYQLEPTAPGAERTRKNQSDPDDCRHTEEKFVDPTGDGDPGSAGESPLTARLWSGPLDDAVTIRGHSGEVFIRLRHLQRLSYSKPNGVSIKLKVVAYKTEGKKEG